MDTKMDFTTITPASGGTYVPLGSLAQRVNQSRDSLIHDMIHRGDKVFDKHYHQAYSWLEAKYTDPETAKRLVKEFDSMG